ncbi:MAG: shikimate kinase [Pseudomonadota bacterium]
MAADTELSDASRSSSAPYETRTIALVGLMGAGKSTVGRRLAEVMGREFCDSDDEIEKAAGLSIADIFTLHGEAEFRRGEKRVMERLLGETPHVLATGGGAYLDPDTRALLRKNAITVWLNADLETLWERVSRRNHRPLLRQPNPRSILAQLLEERAPIYSKADLVVESEDGPHSRTVNRILAAVKGWQPE